MVSFIPNTTSMPFILVKDDKIKRGFAESGYLLRRGIPQWSKSTKLLMMWLLFGPTEKV